MTMGDSAFGRVTGPYPVQGRSKKMAKTDAPLRLHQELARTGKLPKMKRGGKVKKTETSADDDCGAMKKGGKVKSKKRK